MSTVDLPILGEEIKYHVSTATLSLEVPLTMPTRFLNTETIRLEKPGEHIEYAILSHRWIGDSEVTYADMMDDDIERRTAKAKLGWAKIEGACKQARHDHLKYIWIDTCCIDKSNGAELTEELNSMYRYYEESKVCYGYLAGLPDYKNPWFGDEFARHEWFERGWTLQELIAPRVFVFFTDRRLPYGVVDETDWVRLGYKAEMWDTVPNITGIDIAVLNHSKDVQSVSVAKRMSWAARRKTTRVEDRAYCLMGLFDVNISIIYGEGEKAFIRLQEEIMKESSDESLFAWRDSGADNKTPSGLLAKSPDMFRWSGEFFGYYDWEPRAPFFKTNHGLRITLPLNPVGGDSLVMAALNCSAPAMTQGFAGIILQRVTSYESYDKTKYYEQYARVDVGNIFPLDTAADRGKITTLYVRSSPPPAAVYPNNVLQLNSGPEPRSGYTLHATVGALATTQLQLKSWYWVPHELHSAFKYYREKAQLAAILVFSRPNHTKFTILLGSLSDEGDMGAVIEDGFEEQDFEAWRKRFVVLQPQRCGQSVHLDLESVGVEVDERFVRNTKYYVVSVVIKVHPNMVNRMIDGINETPFGNALLTEIRPARKAAEPKAKSQGLGSKMKNGMDKMRK